MRWLALILFLPAFAVLVWLYWMYPRALPVTRKRRAFDLVVVLVALAATAVSIAWAIPAATEAIVDASLAGDAVSRADGATSVSGATATGGEWPVANGPGHADARGPMWPQILATLAAYHVFPLVLGVAAFVRQRLFRRQSA